jgi:hypothetical protein
MAPGWNDWAWAAVIVWPNPIRRSVLRSANWLSEEPAC